MAEIGDGGAVDTVRELAAATPPPGPVGPVGAPSDNQTVYGDNALDKMLVGWSRDVPRELRKATATRRAIRTLRR